MRKNRLLMSIIIIALLTLSFLAAPITVKPDYEALANIQGQHESGTKVVQVVKDEQEEWIIKWRGNVDMKILEDADILDSLEDLNITKIRLKPNVPVGEWLEKWRNHPGIKYISPNKKVTISNIPNDTFIDKQEYLRQIHAFEGWDLVSDDMSKITIAILDTGVDLYHPDLKANLVDGINLIDKDALPMDDNGHGTNVAGILAATANNNSGVAGVTWNSRIMPIKVLKEDGEGESYIVGQGIRYAVDHGAKILLLSLGEPIYTPFMKEAVDYAEEHGVVIIAASGNDGNRLNYPSALHNVVGVGAVDKNDKYLEYSNFGQQLDVVAPGEGIYTTKLGGGYIYNSGTSMAAPQVAGLAALLYQLHPDLTPMQMKDLIKFSTDDVESPGWDIKTGYGRINIEKALQTPLTILKDGYEQNNTLESATPFPLNDILRAQISDGDTDWFKLELPYDGDVEFILQLDEEITQPIKLKFYLKGQQENSVEEEPVIEGNPVEKGPVTEENPVEEEPLTQENGEEIEPVPDDQQSNIPEQATENALFEETQPTINLVELGSYEVLDHQKLRLTLTKGETWIKITPSMPLDSDTKVNVSYRLSNQFYIYQDSYEDNNNTWNAYEVEDINQDIIGTIDKDKDVDWYKLHFDQPGKLYVKVSVDTLRMDPMLTVQFEDREREEIDNQESGKEEYITLDVTTGDYYIQVADFNGYAIAGEYKLQFIYHDAENDEYEPNDLSSLAKKLDFNEEINGYLADRIDYDWFKIVLIKPTYLKLQFTAEKPVESTFLDGNQQIIWNSKTTEWNQEKVMSPGIYYLRFFTDSSSAKYQLTLKEQELDGKFIDIKDHWAKDVIVKLYNEGIITGYNDYTFRPAESISRGQVAAIISRALNLAESEEEISLPFTDVNLEYWAYGDIKKVYQSGIITGYNDKTFKPKAPIHRDELVIMLTRAFQLPTMKGLEPQFNDIDQGLFAFNQINTFKKLEWLTGYEDGTFRPKQLASRAEFVTLLEKVRNRADMQTAPITNNSETNQQQQNQPNESN